MIIIFVFWDTFQHVLVFEKPCPKNVCRLVSSYDFATWCKTGRHHSGQIDSALKRARRWSGLMPSALMRGLELLVQRGLLDDNTREIARQGVEKLERLRQRLLHQLETLVQQAGEDGNSRLLLSGQSLADELAEVEELKQKIDALLEQPPALPGSRQAE